jgi:thioredoxin 2
MSLAHATDADVDDQITGRGDASLVVLDFWSRTCGPCRMVTPVLETLAERHDDSLHVVMVDIADAPETSRRWNVRATPTLIALRNGEELARHSGAIVRGQLVDWVESRL